MSAELAAFAERIDAERAAQLARDAPGRPLARLLGTAYPALTPVLGWQFDALERIESEGWLTARQRGDLMARLLSAAGNFSDAEALSSNLRRAVWAEKARIALRELLTPALGGAGIDVTAREISDLAETAFEVALAEATNALRGRFGVPLRADDRPSTLVVFGMGKLGGLELNAGSDVDVIFLYDTDDGGSELTLHDHWTRVVRRAVATMETPTADGMVWRVDLRLRPEGSRGPIVNSVAAAERYYETWGRLWERAALLRARAIAGDLELGARLSRELIVPFVYRRKVDPSVATALAELVEQSRAELSTAPERDLKLGPGGIREAEFFVQALQLIWGGRDASLRVVGTLPALERLKSRGLVTDREARVIIEAYTLLRRVEHRVQWASGVQTHLVPETERERERLARSLGYAGAAGLDLALSETRERVSELFRSILPEAPRPPSRHRALLASIEEDGEAMFEHCERLFGTPEVGEHLRTLARRPDDLLGALTRERHPDLADQVIDCLLESPDPELSARTLRSFFARFSSATPYISALAADLHAVRRLVTALGASAFVGEAVVSRPDLADVILFGGGAPPDARDVVRTELAEIERGATDDDDEYEARDRVVHGLRRAKRRVMVEVAVADLAGVIATREATRVLSDLADETLARAVNFELGGDARGLAVIAVGKLGGREIGYGSDLDVLFVFAPDRAPPGVDAQEHFVRRAQRVIRLISEPHPAGPGYELDTRLRPSGSHGMLVTSISSFARYHGVAADDAPTPAVASSGAAWERQALIRARACAGDLELGSSVVRLAERAAYEQGAPPVQEMHRLRMRMERELGQERDGRSDLKLGHGGLLDVEFATQWLQMRYGRDPRVRTPDTLDALEALFAAGYLARAEYETLREGYDFLRRLEQRMHVLRGTSSTVLDQRRPGLTQLARRMGFVDGAEGRAAAQLMARYARVTDGVRAAYLRVLGLPGAED